MSFHLKVHAATATNSSNCSIINQGNRLVLPEIVLTKLIEDNISEPFSFKLCHKKRNTSVGVFDFTCADHHCLLPQWLMKNLQLNEGDTIQLVSSKLPKATFIKLKPLQQHFLQLINPRMVLEYHLRYYSCLSIGDVFPIIFNGKEYYFHVSCVNPPPSVSIAETDVLFEFDEVDMSPLFDEIKIPSRFNKEMYFQGLHRRGCKGYSLNDKCVDHNKMDYKKKEYVEEIVGKMRYIYQVSVDGTRKLVKRLPLRVGLCKLI